MDQHSEEETVIVERLQRFQPRPSQTAYQRMANAPWVNLKETTSIMQIVSRSRRTRIVLAALVMTVVASTVVWTTPSLRAVAQELLGTLFNREASSMISVEPFDRANPGDTALTDTLREVSTVENQAGFVVRQPQSIPPGYIFAGAGYTESRHAVSLVYIRPGAELTVTQQPVEYAEYGLLTDGNSGIGPDAPVETVQIGDIAGEYVAGTWVMTSDNQAVWQANVSSQRLRWQEDNMIYEIFVNGGSSDTGSGLDRNTMIAMAVSLQ